MCSCVCVQKRILVTVVLLVVYVGHVEPVVSYDEGYVHVLLKEYYRDMCVCLCEICACVCVGMCALDCTLTMWNDARRLETGELLAFRACRAEEDKSM